MIEKQSLSDQRIIDCLNNEYGIKVAALTVISLGADFDAILYKAQTSENSSYFIKLKRDQSHDIGVIIQLLLHDEISQIIAPIKTNNGQPTHHIDDYNLIVYPFIPGQDGFSRALTNDEWIILGKALRQVHEFRLPVLIKEQIKRESYLPKWREAVRSIYAYIDTQPNLPDNIASQLLRFMQEQRNKIQIIVHRAEQLALQMQKQSFEFVLCHSDFHAGNILIAEKGALYIVDWDQPILAPKERDLMFIGGGVGNVWNDPREEELFYKGYGRIAINREILAYYRYERIVEDIAIYSQQLFLTGDGGKNRTEMYQHFIALFEPNGVIDISLRAEL